MMGGALFWEENMGVHKEVVEMVEGAVSVLVPPALPLQQQKEGLIVHGRKMESPPPAVSSCRHRSVARPTFTACVIYYRKCGDLENKVKI